MCGLRATICADWAGWWGTSAPTGGGWGGIFADSAGWSGTSAPTGGQWSRGVTARARRLGRRVNDSSVSARVMARRPALMPSQRSGSGSQRRRAVAHPRQPDQLGVAAEHEVAQGAPGEVRGGDAVADVPARPGQPGAAVQPDGGPPVPGDPERPAPGVGEAGAPQHREQVEQRRVQRGEHPVVVVELRPDPRPEVVRRPAAAEDQPVVGGALAVDDQVPVVAERLTVRSPISSQTASDSGSVAMTRE